MRHLLLLLACVALLSCLAGCGGFVGCGGDSYARSNPGYAGNYAAGFYQTGDAALTPTPQITFAIAISATGQVTGTATDPTSGHTAPVTGTMLEWFNPCGQDAILLDLRYTLAGEAESRLEGTRAQSIAVHWPFDAHIATGPSRVRGQLLIDPS